MFKKIIIPLLLVYGLSYAMTPDINLELLEVARSGNSEEVQRLLDAGANVDAQGELGLTALMLAACSGNEIVVERLIQASADLNTQDSYGRTALTYAAQYGNVNTVKKLLQAGADLNIKNNVGNTAFDLAWKNNSKEYLRQSMAEIDQERERLATLAKIQSLVPESVLGLLPNELLFEIVRWLPRGAAIIPGAHQK